MEEFKKMLIDNAPRILIAVAVFVIGFVIVKLVMRGLKKIVAKTRAERTVASFLLSVLRIVLYLIVSVSALGTLGVDMSSLLATLAAAALTAGLALQSALNNIVYGIVLLINRPFVAGDVIEFGGNTAIVQRIGIFSTTLKTYDNRLVTISNSNLANEVVINQTMSGLRRVDFRYSVSYDTDFDKAERVLRELVEKCEYRLSEPEYKVRIREYLESAVEIEVWIWTEPKHYFDVYYYMQNNVIREFRKNDIEIPYPHVVVKNNK